MAIGSYFSARISHESFHALFLNPPYLSVLGENGQTGRDEKRFLVNGLCHLMQGGQLVYIIPYYRLTADIARILCDNFEWLSVYKFCGKEFQRFRQVAVLGIRKPRGNGSREVPGLLRQVQDDEKSRTTQRVSSSRYAYLIIIFAKTINNFFIPAMWTTDICIGVITIFPRSC